MLRWTWLRAVSAAAVCLSIGAATGCNGILVGPEKSPAAEEVCVAWMTLLGTKHNENALALAIGPNDELAFVGDGVNRGMEYPAYSGYDALVGKLDFDGEVLWEDVLGTAAKEQGDGLTIDRDGNVIVVGSSEGNLDGSNTSGQYEAFVAVFNAEGQRQWVRQMSSAHDSCAYDAVTDEEGNIYIVGEISGPPDEPGMIGWNDGFVAKYSPSGEQLWVTHVGTGETARLLGIALDDEGRLWATGSGALPGTDTWMSDTLLATLDTDGALQWQLLHPNEGRDEGLRIAHDGAGSAIVAGYAGAQSAVSNPERAAVVTKWNAEGFMVWQFELDSESDDEARDVVVDANGSAYVVGGTARDDTPPDPWDSDPGVGSSRNAPFVLKLDSDGEEEWFHSWPAWGSAHAYGVALGSDGTVFLAGQSPGGVNDGSEAFVMALCAEEE